MEVIFELLFEFLAEVVLQIVFEALAELGARGLRKSFDEAPNQWLASIGYAVFGAIAGVLSLWLFPSLFMPSRDARLVNLALTPLAAGGAMVLIGAWRRRRGQELIRLDRFAYGYLFALCMAGVRFWFGQ